MTNAGTAWDHITNVMKRAGAVSLLPIYITYNIGSVAHVRVISVLILLSDDIQIHAIHALLHSCAIVVRSSSAQNDLGCHGAQVGQRVGGHGEDLHHVVAAGLSRLRNGHGAVTGSGPEVDGLDGVVGDQAF